MSTKSYAKTLIFVCALLAYSGSSVAVAESSSIIPSAYGLDKVNAASNSISFTKRHLRSSADTAVGDCFVSRRLVTSLIDSLSTTVSKFQEWLWRLGRKSSTGSFKDMALHKTEGGPFNNPKISDWAAYVESLYRKSPTSAYKAMFLTLARRYKTAADLAEVLVVAKKNESTRLIASKLLDVQIEGWTKTGKSVEQVFRLLELDKIKDGPLKSPLFLHWVAFVEFKYKNFPGDATPKMLLTLRGHYQTDIALTTALVAGKEVKKTESIASELLIGQTWGWKEDSKSDAHVFELLGLDKTGVNTFKSPVFMQWVDFVKLMNENQPIYAMYTTLKAYYMDNTRFTEILAAGTEIPATKNIAMELQQIEPEMFKMVNPLRFGDIPPDST